jgi:hypothetical protein
MRIGRREVKRRLTGFTLPTVLGTGGGSATWTTEPTDRALASVALQYLENKRVLYVPFEVEIPSVCIRSVREIRTHLTDLIANSQSPELRNPLRAIRAACRQFLTDVEAIQNNGYDLDSTPLVRWPTMSAWVFNQALGSLRGLVGTSVAIIIETFDVDVDEHLARIMPPVHEDDD